MKKINLKNPITNIGNYLGWGILTGLIVLVFHLMGSHALHTPLYRVGILFAIIAIFDILNYYRRSK